jgi:hypothetical protein
MMTWVLRRVGQPGRCLAVCKRILITTHAFSSGGASSSGPIVSHRDIFVEDHSCSRGQWDQIVSKSGSYFRNPASSHIVAEYFKTRYTVGNYNFNVIGEFSLNITAVMSYGCDNNQWQPEPYHSCIIWPDRLVLTKLTKQDIDKITKLCLLEKQLERRDFEGLLSPTSVVADGVKAPHVFSACNQYSSASSARKSLQWFSETLSARPEPATKYKLYLSSTFEGHRAPTSLFVLPSEDSFSYISSSSALEAIVKKIDAF